MKLPRILILQLLLAAQAGPLFAQDSLPSVYIPHRTDVPYSSYDMRDDSKTPAARTQNNTLASWAFSAMASAETRLMPRTPEPFFRSSDVYVNVNDVCSFTPSGDALDGTAYLPYAHRMAAAYISTKRALMMNSGNDSTRYVREISFLPDRASYSDNKAIKEIIYSTGAAVATTFYWKTASYNSANYAYYCSTPTSPNASVALVGWNDNYAATNFTQSPGANGAWLARAVTSSYSSSTFHSTEQFDGGYFWISYRDVNVGQNNSAYTGMATARRMDGDGAGYNTPPMGWVGEYSNASVCNGASSCWASNYFTNSTGHNIRLTAVSFYTAQDSMTYQAIVTAASDGAQYPLGNGSALTRLADQTGGIARAGYHTVMLSPSDPNNLLIANGGHFSLVVGLSTSGVAAQLPFTYAMAGYTASFSPSTGKSFVKGSATIGAWYDTAGGYPSTAGAGYFPLTYAYIDNPDTSAPVPGGIVLNGLTAVDRSSTNYSTQLSFNWPAFSDPQTGIDHYEYAIGSTPSGTDIADWTGGLGSGTTYYQLSGLSLTYNTTYYVRIRAMNTEGLLSVATGTLSGIVVLEPPAAIANLAGSAASNSRVDWTWDRAALNNGYNIYASSNSALIAYAARNTESWSHNISTPNGISGIYIKTLGLAGDYEAATVSSDVYTLANAPGDPSGSATGRNSASLSWASGGNAAGAYYRVEYSTYSGYDSSTFTSYNNELSASLTGLSAFTTYYARAQARNYDGVATSKTASAVFRTWAPVPDPTTPVITPTGSSTLAWSWSENSYADTYRLYSSPSNTLLQEISSGTTHWTETGLSPNTQYTRYLRVVNQSGYSSYSYVVATTSAAAPGDFGISASARTVLLAAWTSGGNPSGTSYRVEVSTKNTFETACTQVSTVTALSAYFSALTPGETYYSRAFGIGPSSSLSDPTATASLSMPGRPNVSSLSPNSTDNMQTSKAIAVTGTNFVSGDYAVARRSGQADRTAESTTVTGGTSATAYFKTLGMEAGAWTVYMRDADGVESTATAQLTVTDASQTGAHNLTHTDAGSSRATVTTVGGGAVASVPAGITQLEDSAIYTSSSPVNSPLLADPAQINAATRALPAGTVLLSASPLELAAYLGGEQVTSRFSSAVTLRVNFTDSDLDGVVDGQSCAAATLYAVELDTQTSTWKAVSGSAVNVSGQYVTAPLYHFSVYALAGATPSSNLEEAKFYPNPWEPGSGGSHDRVYLRMAGLPAETEVYIYNVAGELVIHIPATSASYYDWDGRNGSGETVVSGVYFARLKTPSQSKTIKFAIQR
ncbi:MAG: T9SS type A sorting domain-containing protein [Elusimicrobia bacterium]|nr:T9SS type A sorting domain-containing protein [Elusimicrobiota bacterium]